MEAESSAKAFGLSIFSSKFPIVDNALSLAYRHALNALMPQDCLLCGAPSGTEILCGGCLTDLPWLPDELCPICAHPCPDKQVCGACLRHPPHFDATCATFRYAFPADKLIQALKFSHRLGLAEFLASAMLDGLRPQGDLLLPLPLSPGRLRERGFNQAVELARPLARALGLPLELDICHRRVETTPQSLLPWKERRKNIRHAFECNTDLSGQSIIVVDDVMTSGATLDEFAATLKRHGAAHVSAWVAARTLKGEP
jgi:ComF family protein